MIVAFMWTSASQLQRLNGKEKVLVLVCIFWIFVFVERLCQCWLCSCIQCYSLPHHESEWQSRALDVELYVQVLNPSHCITWRRWLSTLPLCGAATRSTDWEAKHCTAKQHRQQDIFEPPNRVLQCLFKCMYWTLLKLNIAVRQPFPLALHALSHTTSDF